MSQKIGFNSCIMLLISFILTLCLGADIRYRELYNLVGNLDNTLCSIWNVLEPILYDISVGVFSAMILVFCIDRIQEKAALKEEHKKHLMIYKKISPLLKEYYDFFLELYIATRKDLVSANSEVLDSLYACINEFIEQLNQTNPFYKSGPMSDGRIVKELIQACKENLPEDEFLSIEERSHLPWYKCWEIKAKSFYDDMLSIEQNYPTFLPAEMIELYEKTVEYAKLQSNMSAFIENRMIADYLPLGMELPDFKMPTEFFIQDYNLIDTIHALDSIMKYVESNSDIVLRKRSLEFFNERNCAPKIGASV